VTRIERSIEIDAPPKRVFEALAHWDGLAQWSTVTDSHQGPERCTGVGDEFEQTIRVAGIGLETQWEVTRYEPPSTIAYRATGPGGSRMDMRQTVTPAPAGSRLELDIDYDLPGGVLGDVVDRLYVERRNEREAEHTLQNLKDYLEDRAGA
jgi:uncharacterized protein YndB with AHSA1/START domain